MNRPATEELIYKVVTADAWEIAESQGEFRGAEIDLADRFIHFSAQHQVRETVDKHFYGQHGLLLIGVHPEKLGDALRWETSRGGKLFPHLYDSLSLDCVDSVDELPIGKDGNHLFPDKLFGRT